MAWSITIGPSASFIFGMSVRSWCLLLHPWKSLINDTLLLYLWMQTFSRKWLLWFYMDVGHSKKTTYSTYPVCRELVVRHAAGCDWCVSERRRTACCTLFFWVSCCLDSEWAKLWAPAARIGRRFFMGLQNRSSKEVSLWNLGVWTDKPAEMTEADRSNPTGWYDFEQSLLEGAHESFGFPASLWPS